MPVLRNEMLNLPRMESAKSVDRSATVKVALLSQTLRNHQRTSERKNPYD